MKLRIRIPKLWLCPEDTCSEFSKNESYCDKCLYTRMGKHVPTTAFASKTQIVHRPTFGSDGSRLRKVY